MCQNCALVSSSSSPPSGTNLPLDEAPQRNRGDAWNCKWARAPRIGAQWGMPATNRCVCSCKVPIFFGVRGKPKGQPQTDSSQAPFSKAMAIRMDPQGLEYSRGTAEQEYSKVGEQCKTLKRRISLARNRLDKASGEP